MLAERIPLYEQALAKDPSFAPAYAGLAQVYIGLSGNARFDIPDAVGRLKAAAEKAVQLDPVSAESYDALGAARARDGQWEQAEKNFRRALQIEPQRSDSHEHFAIYYLLPLGGVDQGIRELRVAEKGDPLSSEIQAFLLDALRNSSRNSEFDAVCHRPLSDVSEAMCRVETLTRQFRFEEIYKAKLDPPTRGCVYARAGRKEDAEMTAAGAVPEDQARIYACLNDRDHVFESLDRATTLGPIRVGWTLNRVARDIPSLRFDPRMKAIRRKAGLPE